MQLPKDLLTTILNAIQGRPIGSVHIQIIHSHFARGDMTPEERKSSEVRVKKFLCGLGANTEMREVVRRVESKANGLPLRDWPEEIIAEFVDGIDPLIDHEKLFDDVPVFAISTRSTAGERYPKQEARPYGCSTWCLQFTWAGTAEATIRERRINLKAGDVVLIPPRIPFYFDRARDSRNWYHYSIYFRPRPHAVHWLDWGNPQGGLLLGHLPESEQERLQQIFQELIRLRDSNSPVRRELEFNLLEQLLLRCRAAIDLPRNSVDERIVLAKAYIAEHYADDLKIADVASATGLSRSRLSVLFHQQVGATIFEWRDQQRVARATQLLRDTNLSIKEVAAQVGYSDALYFSRVFHRYSGVTPTSIRND